MIAKGGRSGDACAGEVCAGEGNVLMVVAIVDAQVRVEAVGMGMALQEWLRRW